MSPTRVQTMLSVPRVHHGPGALAELAALIVRFGGKPVLVTDPGLKKAGLVDQVVQAAGVPLPVFDQVEPEPRVVVYQACVDYLKAHEATVVVALGGGSSMDVAKLSAVALRGKSATVYDAFRNKDLDYDGLPVIAIPTTAGTGSEASPAVVYGDPESGAKVGIRSDYMMARAAILDPLLTLGLPQWLTASTGMDALTHAIECYISVNATPIADMYSEQSIALIGEHLPTAYARGADVEARDGMLVASYYAGISLALSAVAGVHALAHTMGGMYHVSHGVANAVLLPYVMRFCRVGCREKFANVAELLGEPTDGLSLDDASELAIDVVFRLSESIGIPQHLREASPDLTDADLAKIAETAVVTQARLLATSPRYMGKEEALQVLREAW